MAMGYDNSHTAFLLVAFMVTYTIGACVLGAVDTLSDYKQGGTDRIINSNQDLLLVLTPVIIVGAVLTILHIRDATGE